MNELKSDRDCEYLTTIEVIFDIFKIVSNELPNNSNVIAKINYLKNLYLNSGDGQSAVDDQNEYSAASERLLLSKQTQLCHPIGENQDGDGNSINLSPMPAKKGYGHQHDSNLFDDKNISGTYVNDTLAQNCEHQMRCSTPIKSILGENDDHIS